MNALFRPPVSILPLALVAVSLSCFPPSVRAYDVKSPEVVALVKKAVGYLETQAASDSTAAHFGGHCIIAYALVKAGAQHDHPKVQAAVRIVKEQLTKPEEEWGDSSDGSIYSVCTSLILLCELDEQQYSAEIQKLLDHILRRQHQSGCWGYRTAPSVGDTSQQQYAILSLWTADYNGFQVPTDAIERGLNWLMRVQDPQGRYTYKPTDPGSFQPINQPAVFRPSLQAAGTGSLYVAGDLLKLHAKTVAEDEEILPPALRMIKADTNRPGAPRIVKNVSEDVYSQRVATADNAFAAMYAMSSPWMYYYLYTLERYASFRATATGAKNVGWYDDGVDFLAKNQKPDGSWWGTETTSGSGVDTAFGVLFLVRSTAKSIQRKIQREGLLLGGVGLPTDTTNVRIRGGRVVGMELSKNLDDLIGLLESENAQEDVELLAQQIEQLEIVPGAKLDDAQTARLNRLAGHPAYDVRILAAKAMMRSRDVRVAPALIYALSDPDDRVKTAAVDGLRFISRRFDGMGLPPNPSKLEIEKTQEYWRAWYRSVAPPGSPVQ
jgi:hypothetical protein